MKSKKKKKKKKNVAAAFKRMIGIANRGEGVYNLIFVIKLQCIGLCSICIF